MTDDNTDDTADAQADEHVKRTDEGASIEVGITRGTGTRDQEKWKIKGKGATAEQALSEFRRELEAVVGPLTDGPYGDQVRAFDPDDDGDEDDN